LANKRNGLDFEKEVEHRFKDKTIHPRTDLDVLTQYSFKTDIGLRRADLVVINKKTEYVFVVEVKSGNAPYGSGIKKAILQSQKDALSGSKKAILQSQKDALSGSKKAILQSQKDAWIKKKGKIRSKAILQSQKDAWIKKEGKIKYEGKDLDVREVILVREKCPKNGDKCYKLPNGERKRCTLIPRAKVIPDETDN
jgi:hypothetical protein